jgi:hypothetical protein
VKNIISICHLNFLIPNSMGAEQSTSTCVATTIAQSSIVGHGDCGTPPMTTAITTSPSLSSPRMVSGSSTCSIEAKRYPFAAKAAHHQPQHQSWYSFGGESMNSAMQVVLPTDVHLITSNGTELLPLRLSRPRSSCGAVRVGSFIYLIGGRYWNDDKPADLVERFNIHNHTFRRLSPLPEPRYGHSCVLYQDLYIYVIGGGLGSCVVHTYDIVTNKWSTGPSLERSVRYPCSVVVNDCIYCFSNEGGK